MYRFTYDMYYMYWGGERRVCITDEPCYGTHLEVRGQLEEVSLLSQCGSQEDSLDIKHYLLGCSFKPFHQPTHKTLH